MILDELNEKIDLEVLKLTDKELAALLGISRQGAKKKVANRSYNLTDIGILLKKYRVIFLDNK